MGRRFLCGDGSGAGGCRIGAVKTTPGYNLERRGRFLVAVSESPTAKLTREMVEETREEVRRERAEAAATDS